MARLTAKKLESLKEDLTHYPMPTPLDIKKAEVAAMVSKDLKDFAEHLGVDLITIKVWANKSREFWKAINSWETVETFNIKKNLAKRANGFTKSTYRDVITKTGSVETLKIETYYPPSETAIQFWLKNRAPNDWQDKKEIDVNVNANIRAWLVSAGGAMDPTEVLDIGPGSLIEQQVQEIVDAEFKDNTQAELEAELISDLIEEVRTEEVSDFNLVVNKPEPVAPQPENNSSLSPNPSGGPQWSVLNGKWT